MVEVAIRQDLPPVPCIASPVKTSQPTNVHANAKLVVSSIRICSHLSLWRNTASLPYLGLQAHGICIFVFLFVSVPVFVFAWKRCAGPGHREGGGWSAQRATFIASQLIIPPLPPQIINYRVFILNLVSPVLPKNWDLTLAFIWHKFPISVPIVAMLISRHPTFNLITLWSLPRKKLLSSAAWMSQDDVKENYFIDALQKGEGEKREGGVAKVYYRMFP